MKTYYIIGQPYINNIVYAEDEKVAQSTPNITFQWQRSNVFNLGFEDIENATTYQYQLTQSDKYVRCLVRDTDTQDYTYTNTIEALGFDYKSNARDTATNVTGSGMSLDDIVDDVSGDATIVSDKDLIDQAIDIVLSTTREETPILTLGSSIPTMLFENVTDNLLDRIRTETESALNTQVPQIKLNKVNVLYDGLYTITVQIYYLIKNTNVQSSYTKDLNVNS